MKKITVAAAALIRDHKLFIAKRPANKLPPLVWEFPGGKPESGETLPEALQRELREELHIDTKIGDFIARTTHTYDFAEVEISLFKAEMVDPAAPIVDNEHIETAWVRPEDLNSYDFAAADIGLLDALRKMAV